MPDYQTETLIIDSEGFEHEAIVYFDYQPYEAQERNYPGCDAEISINSIEFNNQMIDLDSFDKETIDYIEQDCWDFIRKENDK